MREKHLQRNFTNLVIKPGFITSCEFNLKYFIGEDNKHSHDHFFLLSPFFLKFLIYLCIYYVPLQHFLKKCDKICLNILFILLNNQDFFIMGFFKFYRNYFEIFSYRLFGPLAWALNNITKID